MIFSEQDIINFDNRQVKKPIIKIIGVGGGGNNAVERMYKQQIKDVSFAVCNTDKQVLDALTVDEKIWIGKNVTGGKGTGNNPELGKRSVEEDIELIDNSLDNDVKMLFLTAGMGKGVGTGAISTIARRAREKGILTVAVVTMPNSIEGNKVVMQANHGLEELKDEVDALIVINNALINQLYGSLPLSEAFAKANDILYNAVKGISEIITLQGYINVDFADVKTVLKSSGVALMSTAVASGENRAIECVKEALNSPLLNNNNIKGAKNILLNIISGKSEITMDEVTDITHYIQKQTDSDSNLIWGCAINDDLGDNISVTLVAAGFNESNAKQTSYIPEKLIFEIDDPAIQESLKEEEKPEDNMLLYNYNRVPTRPLSDRTKRKVANSEKEPVQLTILDVLDKPSDEKHEKLDSIPAYQRQSMSMPIDERLSDRNKKTYSFSLEDDEIVISKDNSYLHDNVD